MIDDFKLSDRHILVTGASSGIGRACVVACQSLGARVTMLARNEERLKQVLGMFENADHHGYSCVDLRDKTTLHDVIEKAVANRGKIDGMIHAAGIRETMPLASSDWDCFTKTMDVNVTAGFQLLRLLLNRKRRNKQFSSVFISSVMSVVGQPGSIVYSISKGAINSGVRSAAIELVGKGVRVNSVSPGMVKSEMSDRIFASLPGRSQEEIVARHPSGLGECKDIANLCVFLLSDAARWITGANIIIDGGYSIQ